MIANIEFDNGFQLKTTLTTSSFDFNYFQTLILYNKKTLLWFPLIKLNRYSNFNDNVLQKPGFNYKETQQIIEAGDERMKYFNYSWNIYTIRENYFWRFYEATKQLNDQRFNWFVEDEKMIKLFNYSKWSYVK